MRTVPALAALLFVTILAGPVVAQRGRGEPEEIQNRTGAFFVDAEAPRVPSGQPIDLAQTEFVRAAVAAGQLSVLYLYDSTDDEEVRGQFERGQFNSQDLGICLRCFHCGRIDVSKDEALKDKFAKQTPMFFVFDEKGKLSGEASMADYRPSISTLSRMLEKAAQGVIKPSLDAFSKQYSAIVREIRQVVTKRTVAQEKRTRAKGDDPESKKKRAEAEKELADLVAEEQKLILRENELLAKMKLPERPANAKRIGAPRWGGR
jgi:hypothetical protein